ncbi:hypothetical protein VoSk93_43490 [Vibrio owensii]
MCQALWAQVLRLQLEESLFIGKRMFGEFDSTDRYSQLKNHCLFILVKVKKYSIYSSKPRK